MLSPDGIGSFPLSLLARRGRRSHLASIYGRYSIPFWLGNDLFSLFARFRGAGATPGAAGSSPERALAGASMREEENGASRGVAPPATLVALRTLFRAEPLSILQTIIARRGVAFMLA
jgi:hypothetical protein